MIFWVRLVSRVAGQAPGAGESAVLHFARSRIHLFDPETERAIGDVDGAAQA